MRYSLPLSRLGRTAGNSRRVAVHLPYPYEDYGKLLLRLTIAALILLHGVAKMRNGVGPIADMLVKNGWPAAMAYLAYVGEVVAPLMLIVGWWTRPAALVIAVNMVVAILLAHSGDVFEINQRTGGWAIELQGLYLFGALAIALLGAGRLSAAGPAGRWN